MNIYTADFETDPFKIGRLPKAFTCDIYDGENHLEFWGDDCAYKLMQHFLTLPEGLIYFHNGGGFDFHFLIPHLPKDAEVFVINNKIAKIVLGNVELRDSYLILPVPLKASGNKLEFDYSKLEANKRDKYKDEILEYQRQDCVALYELVSTFIKDYGNNLTLAASAFKQLKNSAYSFESTTESFDEKFRPFYKGGRVEFFKLGVIKKDIKVVDINSAYPYAMTFPHWLGKRYKTARSIPEENAEQSFYIIECESNGAFAVRSKVGIDFPRGKGEFHVSGWELLTALELDLVKDLKIKRVYIPEKVQAMDDYVNRFYSMKQQAEKDGDKEKRLFAKLFLNSSYGKLAQDPKKFKEHLLYPRGINLNDEFEFSAPNFELWALKMEWEESGLALWERPAAGFKMYYNTATAASITGFVRAMLLKAMNNCKGVLYCDTDSIICEDIGDLKLGKKLGEWDLEAEGDSIAIGGKKLYSVRTNDGKYKTASKGVKLTPEQIFQVAEGRIITWESFAPSYSISKAVTQESFIKRKVKRPDLEIKKSTRKFKRVGGFSLPNGEFSILDMIIELGKIKSLPAAKRKGKAEYDGYNLEQGFLRILRSKSGLQPDIMAMSLKEYGYCDGTSDDLWNQIDKAYLNRKREQQIEDNFDELYEDESDENFDSEFSRLNDEQIFSEFVENIVDENPF